MHGVVAGSVRRLVLGRTVPVEADRGEVAELTVGDVLGRAVVEVLDADQEAAAGGPGEQPRQQRGADVADVQVRRRARREPAACSGAVIGDRSSPRRWLCSATVAAAAADWTPMPRPWTVTASRVRSPRNRSRENSHGASCWS